MTYHIPHGVFLKLEKIPGIYIKKCDVSGRDLFHFRDGIQEVVLIDNGYNNMTGQFWRFFNLGSRTHGFGTEVLPITVEITDKNYSFRDKKNIYSFSTVEAGEIFYKVLETYYGKGLPNLIIEDKRKKILEERAAHKRQVIIQKQEEIFQIQKEIDEINKERNLLYEDIEDIEKYGFHLGRR